MTASIEDILERSSIGDCVRLRVLVCGGRDFSDFDAVDRELSKLHAVELDGGRLQIIVAVIHGDARGADQLGAVWARSHGIVPTPFPADWGKHGRAAGPIRNQRMLDEGKPDLVVAFPGGAGTADMVRRAKRSGVTVVEVE